MKLPRLPPAAVARGHYQNMYLGSLYTADQMRQYAQKCVEEEREACARLCDEPGWNAAHWCAKQIRARGTHDKPTPTPVHQSPD